jgi:hypothetical protein
MLGDVSHSLMLTVENQTVTEMQNSNTTGVHLLDFVFKCDAG